MGSVRIDPHFTVPEYIRYGDIHLMPGGNAHDDGSILQGAMMNRGGAVYMLGRNGGMLNDGRGQTAHGACADPLSRLRSGARITAPCSREQASLR
ncbi:hypothetical protein AB3M93_16725 [Novosphingobium panipatense]|uniref:hypothetical protein n=1 Tax=Novosphingobium TaxID=165696 RepID=UPI0011AFCE54|nr:hypothetical protein [Novosphingobium sp. HII-3]